MLEKGHAMPIVKQVPNASGSGKPGLIGFLCACALALSACGGGSGGQSSATAPTSSVAQARSLTVQVTTTSGAPVSGAQVLMFDQQRATDTAGQVRYDNVSARHAWVNVAAPGFYGSSRTIAVPTTGENVAVALAMKSFSEAVPVVLAVRPFPANEGRTVTVEVDLAVLDQDGAAVEAFAASDFALGSSVDCGWGGSDVVGADGSWVGCFVGPAPTVPIAFRFVPQQAAASGPIAVLLDQGAPMAAFDPDGLRLAAVSNYFESITAPGTVALGSYRGVAESPAVTNYGGFTSDGKTYVGAVKALAGQEAGPGASVLGALQEMISFTAANAPADPASPRPSLAVVNFGGSFDAGGFSDAEPACRAPSWDSWVACQLGIASVSDLANAHGIPVVAISIVPFAPGGGGGLATGGLASAAHVAARTQGAYIPVGHPSQLPVVLRGLGAVVGRTVGFHRLRFELVADRSGAFVPGSTAFASLSVRISEGTHLRVDLPVFIGP